MIGMMRKGSEIFADHPFDEWPKTNSNYLKQKLILEQIERKQKTYRCHVCASGSGRSRAKPLNLSLNEEKRPLPRLPLIKVENPHYMLRYCSKLKSKVYYCSMLHSTMRSDRNELDSVRNTLKALPV